MINLVTSGAVGDGVTDNFSVIQGECDSAPYGGQLYLPAGNYRTSATVDFKDKALRLIGDGQGIPIANPGYFGGSRIFGTIDGPVLRCNYPAEGSGYSDLGIANMHPTGVGMLLGGVNVSVERVVVSAFRGITGPENTFMLGLRNIILRCSVPRCPVGSIGLQIVGHSSVMAVDVVGFDQAIRVAGIGNGVRDVRLEVNRVGLVIGMNADGIWGVNGTVCEGLSLEANDIGIHIRHMNASVVRGVLIQGSEGSPSQQSQIGVLMSDCSDSSVENLNTAGSFSQAAIRVMGGGGRDTWRHVTANNTHPTGKTWELPASRVRWGIA